MSDKPNEREKKKRITIITCGIIVAFLIILAILLGVLLPKSCAKQHSHTFDKEVVKADYLKSEATHASGAIYYKSCECGAMGTETFVYGEAVPHTFDKEVVKVDYLKSEATHTSGAIYYKSCECGVKGTDEYTFVYGNPTHTYDKEVAEVEYLKSEATHTSKAIYYKSCECGAKGTDEDTFEYGYYLPTEGLTYGLMGTEYTASKGTATDAHIVIADQIDGIPVTAINTAAFSSCSWLQSIVIPDSVTTINVAAFNSCSSLQSIVIPDSVTTIGMSAFAFCSNLTSVKLSSNLTVINSNIFNGCVQLQSIIIPESVTSIGGSAFNNCPNLTAIYYTGTEESWENININSTGNDAVNTAIKYYYAENAEDVAADGNYWHYDTDGITPVIWEMHN